MPKQVSTNKARQGRLGLPVFVVLVFSLALAGVVWLGLEFWGASIDPQDPDQPGAGELSETQPLD